MDLLKRFVEYLGSQKNNISEVTVKNYRADVGQFLRWFEKTFNKQFNTKDVTPEVINIYRTSRPLSSRSLKRHLSSLAKFFHFLKIEGVISNSSKNLSSPKDKWHLNEFKDYLYVYNLASLTIKNYIIDMRQFFVWLEEVTGINKEWNIRKKNVFEKINSILINEYKERLLTPRSLAPLSGVGLSPKTINRKLSSLRKYISFAREQNLIKTGSESLQIKNENLETRANQPLSYVEHVSPPTQQNVIKYSRIPPIRLLQKTTNGILFIVDSLLVLPLARTIEQVKYVFWKIKGKPVFKDMSSKKLNRQKAKQIVNYPKSFYDPLSISTRYFPLHKKLLHHIRHNRPKWYKKYHSYSVVHYFHFAILVIFMSAIGFSIYNDFINKAQNKAVLSALDGNMPRIFAFKGRLTDSLDNPITIANTPLRMAIYNDQTATQSALLWQEVVSVNPNIDGVFETILGNNVLIPQNIFFQNHSLWLGISIGQTAELTPRQELATVSYAVNTQTLQGLPPITNQDAGSQNVILALDSSGNLNIGGSAAPHFQATGGQFTLSGKVLLLTTVYGSQSDVVISPDGLGKIDLQKPLQNTSDNNNIPNAIGAVEIDDLLAVLATSSAQSALTINQDGTAPIITASASGTAKFTVENSGNIISAKGANWQPTLDSSNGLNIASSSGIPFVTFDTLHQSVGIGTVIPQTSLDVFGSFRASGDITLSKFRSNAGIIYASSSGALSQITPGTSTQCLFGGSLPKFDTCPPQSENFISRGNGAIFPYNSTLDLLVGSESTSSAKFAFINVNSGTPTASISANSGNNAAYLTGDGSLATTNRGTLTIGNSATYNTTGNVLINPNGIGNVGVGTTTPLATLDVRGTASVSGALTLTTTPTIQSTSNQTLNLGGDTTGNIVLSGHNGTNNGIFFSGYGTGIIHAASTGRLTSSAIDLASSDVTGVLPILNGGTNNSTAYTAGSVIFSNGTSLTQNNSAFFWDNTSKRLGLNTINPKARLHAAGGNVYLESSIGLANQDPYFSLAATSYSASAGTFRFEDFRDPQNYPSFIWNVVDNSGEVAAYSFRTGDVGALTITQDGNIGIGTTTPLFKIDMQDSRSGNAAAQIFNTSTGTDADGLIVKLGNTSTTAVNSANHFISFETSGIGIVGSIQGNGGKGVTYATSGPADFAEYFKKDENQNIEYGSVVCINALGLVLPCDKNNTNMVGIASENPAFLGGENLGNKSIAVGLVGQVYTKVSTLNGNINPGDPLTYSLIPGVTVKATKLGQIVGKAIQGFYPSAGSGDITQCPDNQKTASDEAVYGGSEPVRGSDLSSSRTITQAKENVNTQVKRSGPEGDRTPGTRLDRSVPNQSGPTPSSLCDKIMVSVNVSWYDPDVYLTDTGDLSIVDQELGSSNQVDNMSLSSIINDSLFMIQNTSGEVIERIGAFAQIAVANLQVGFIKAEEITSQRIVSPIAEIEEIRTNLISPLASESPIVVSGKLVIRQSRIETNDILIGVENASGSAVVTIDSSGNASFSGTLSSKNLEVDSDATVSGTLRAKRILAENIEGLDEKVSTLAAQTVDIKIRYEDIKKKNENPPSVENLNALWGTFINGLMSFGPTSLAETSIAGQLYVQGSLVLAGNSINVLGQDLELQPLREGGISILAGLITIDNNGNLKAGGNAEFAKDVKIKGDLVASGSATFSKINLSLVQPALAVSQTEIIATGSAGVAAIKANQTELVIKNSLVTEKSLIYITPVGTPSAQAPFLMRQTLDEPALSGVEGSFSVGIQTPKSEDLLFNWLILN